MRKVIRSILIIFFIFSLHLIIRYSINEIYINKYNNEEYESSLNNLLRIINYPETYIAYYNKGNSYYQLEEYSNAEKEYEKALKTAPKKRICPIRINLSLSKLAELDYVNDTNIKNELETIQYILLENDCATTDNDGIDDEAQKLYNEIEELKNSSSSNGNKEDPKQENNNNNNNQNEEEKELEEKLKQQKIDAIKDRDDNDYFNRYDYEYYTGKTW